MGAIAKRAAHLVTCISLLILASEYSYGQEITTKPIVSAGLKHISLTVNVPAPNRDALIDLYIRDASCLFGSAGATLQSGRVFGSLALEATAARNVDVITRENEPWGTRPLPFKWPGTDFSTWDIDGTVGWLFNNTYGPLVGLRYDHLTVAMGIPTDGAGAPLILPGVNATFGGDLKVKTWIPYIGLKLIGENYTAHLLYTPLASTRATTSQSGGGQTGPASYEFNSWDWDISGTGSFAEVAMDYKAFASSNSACNVWGKATWMSIDGNGQWTGLVQGTPGPRPDNYSDSGLISRHDLSIGLSGQLFF